MAERIALLNGKLITPFREIDMGFVLIKDDLIEKIGQIREAVIPEGAQIIDVTGLYIRPGFIDSQLNGALPGR